MERILCAASEVLTPPECMGGIYTSSKISKEINIQTDVRVEGCDLLLVFINSLLLQSLGDTLQRALLV